MVIYWNNTLFFLILEKRKGFTFLSTPGCSHFINLKKNVWVKLSLERDFLTQTVWNIETVSCVCLKCEDVFIIQSRLQVTHAQERLFWFDTCSLIIGWSLCFQHCRKRNKRQRAGRSGCGKANRSDSSSSAQQRGCRGNNERFQCSKSAILIHTVMNN